MCRYFGEPPEPTPFDEPMDDFMREELARPPASAQCKGLDPRLPLQAYVLVLSGAAQFRRSKTMRKLTEEELVEQCKVRLLLPATRHAAVGYGAVLVLRML
jgi:hypothetical protein